MVDFQAFRHPQVREDPPDRRMLDLIDAVRRVDLGIDDARLILEERRQPPYRDVAILVDGGADNRATVLAEPRWIIGATAEQRNAKRGAADYHAASTILRRSLCRVIWPMCSRVS